MRKDEMVARINDLLEMNHRLSVWQFLQIRRYELREMVSKIEELYYRASESRDHTVRPTARPIEANEYPSREVGTKTALNRNPYQP